jgi:two-component system chemotaxis response regulator CheY
VADHVEMAGLPILLVVDDSPTIRGFVRVALRGLPVEIVEAEDGLLGLEAVARDLPSLLLVDIQMPALDGIGLLKALRADDDPAVRALPVLLLTAERGDVLRDEALAAGANGLLEKPLRIPAIRAAVEEHLARLAARTAGGEP